MMSILLGFTRLDMNERIFGVRATEFIRAHLVKILIRNSLERGVGCFVFVGCLTSQQHASVSQGWICSDNFTCCHTEEDVADQTFYLTQSQYTDTGPTSPSADPITPDAWQGSHWSTTF